MKYIDIKTVVDSYVGFQDRMTNKSWGYLALLKGCKDIIRPLNPYKVDMDVVSNFLEEIFNLSQTKKTYDGVRLLHVVFSKKWEQYFIDQGRYTPNIYDVAIWAYRRKAFSDDVTKEQVISDFSKEFNIPFEVITKSFDTTSKEILFTDSLYQESLLKTELGKVGVDVSRNNIDAKKGGVVASPGEISRGPFVQTLYTGLEISDYVLILQSDYNTLYGDKGTKCIMSEKDMPLQQIFYGAPGTGKSYKINRETEDEDVIRTTFHPDTDYSSFVGAYKPTTVNERVMTTIGTKAVPVDNEDGTPRYESKIIYEFVCQSFLQAYVKAWEKYAEAGQGEPKKQFLVIEEINRGNCAQIFGDLFQLLDRNDKGFSDYPITADADMKKQLKKLLGNLTIEDKESINKYYKGRDVVSEVLNGDILLLPNNLYIWATMNTSDQSLFPIDSAFKRRWNWQYIPISNRQEGYKIEVNGSYYDWWEFLLAINDEIWSINHSEDKKLGYFFAKADGNNVINSDLFVGKVIFYLWNDVFKDFIEESGDIFKDEDGTPLSFDKFYVTSLSGDTKVVEKKAERFLKNLKLEPIPSNIDEDASNDFKVTYNGLVYKEGNATDTFIKVLEAIGLESLVDKEFDNCIVVTKGDKAKSRVFRQIGDYFIYIGLWSKYKKRWMKVMAESMNLDLQIEE